MSAPNPETNVRVLETTFAELGVDTSSDNLGLASDRFTLGVKKDGKDTVFVGLLKHPLAGGHFAQLLNSVSPFPDQNAWGIIDDINLPILAERAYQKGLDRFTSEPIRLHERHLEDPRVGPHYIRFAEDHVDAWLKALKSNTGLRVFETLQRIRFIDSTEDIRKELFSEDGSSRQSLKVLIDVVAFARYRDGGISRALSQYDHGRFMDLWENKNLRGKELAQAFLDTLTTKAEQEKFAIAYFKSRGQIIADLESHRIIKDKLIGRSGKVKVKFDGNGRNVMVSNNTGTKVVISPTEHNSARFNWKVIDYQFSKGYIRRSLYPAIAWKKDENGKRTFLTQKEAMLYVREFGLEEREQGDVKLGEIGVGYFSRDIIGKWPAKMTLKPLDGAHSRGDYFEQPMRGAQMPAWVGIERHKDELLRSETSLLAIIESNLALAA